MNADREVRYPECLFCGEPDVDAAHLSACSLRDTQAKLAAKNMDLDGMLKNIVAVKAFAEVYDASSEIERKNMWVCQGCYGFGFAPSIPPHCAHCQSAYTVSAIGYVNQALC